jgi:hypothetical protein
MAELHVIPLDMAEAFSEAVLAYSNWTPSIPEFRVRLGGDSFTMSAICDLVDKYPDQLPDKVLAVLRSYFHDMPHGDLKERLATDRSYAIGARCLRRLIERRKARNR